MPVPVRFMWSAEVTSWLYFWPNYGEKNPGDPPVTQTHAASVGSRAIQASRGSQKPIHSVSLPVAMTKHWPMYFCKLSFQLQSFSIMTRFESWMLCHVWDFLEPNISLRVETLCEDMWSLSPKLGSVHPHPPCCQWNYSGYSCLACQESPYIFQKVMD